MMYFAGMIIVFNIGFGSNLAVFTSIITAEVVAKYVMVLLANRAYLPGKALVRPSLRR